MNMFMFCYYIYEIIENKNIPTVKVPETKPLTDEKH